MQLAETILGDSTLIRVDSMARSVIRQGFNAGSGYSQIWARDMNTFIETACEENDPAQLRQAILLFFALRNPLLGLLDIMILDLLVALYLLRTLRHGERLAGWLFAPYLAWILFATYLNGYILVANGSGF